MYLRCHDLEAKQFLHRSSSQVVPADLSRTCACWVVAYHDPPVSATLAPACMCRAWIPSAVRTGARKRTARSAGPTRDCEAYEQAAQDGKGEAFTFLYMYVHPRVVQREGWHFGNKPLCCDVALSDI